MGIDLKSLRPEQLDQTKIEDLVAENLGPGESLEILMEDELRDALQRFVDKDEKSALAECVHGLLQRLQVVSNLCMCFHTVVINCFLCFFAFPNIHAIAANSVIQSQSDVELLRNRSLAKTLPQQSMGDAIRAEVGDAIRAEVTRHALARMDNVARGSDSTEKGRERTDTRSRAGYFQSLEATDNLATTATIARTTNSNYSAGQTYLKNFLQPHSSTVSQSGTHGSDNSGRKQQIPEGSRSNNGRQFISSQRPKRAKVQQTADSSTDEILDEDIRSDDDWGVLDDIGQDHIPPMKGQGSNNTVIS